MTKYLSNFKQRLRFLFDKISVTTTKFILGNNVTAVLVEGRNDKFLLPKNDTEILRSFKKFGTYGDEELGLIDKLITVQSNVLFVGAHVGTLGIPTARNVNSVCLIEANPTVFQLLEKNILLNNVKNAESINIAIGEHEGKIDFIQNSQNTGGSKRQPINKKMIYYYDNPDEISIDMTTIDTLNTEKTTFDLIVMDIEGSEFFALKGMKNSLSKSNHLIIEFIPHHLRDVANVSVSEFLKLITPFYNSIYVPTLGISADIDNAEEILNTMYDEEKSDPSLIFSKLCDIGMHMEKTEVFTDT